ncbi:MAG: hypothetical protein Q9159_004513 [Coniocarpon cinnabarinum]
MERQEYPSMLASLEPPQAVSLLNSRMNQIAKTNKDIANCVFNSPWQRIVQAARELAQSHSDFAERIENDVILSLRQFETQNREVQQMSTIQGNLGAMAKEYDQAQKKADKLNAKASRGGTGRIPGSSEEVDKAMQQWESQAPYVFEQLQAVDETRLNHLRDVLTQFETHEVDHIEKAKGQAEQCQDVEPQKHGWRTKNAIADICATKYFLSSRANTTD